MTCAFERGASEVAVMVKIVVCSSEMSLVEIVKTGTLRVEYFVSMIESTGTTSCV